MKHHDLIKTLLTVIITASMVAAAELTGEKEIIFPEIMALATGALVAPKRSWQVNPSKMIALIASCSVAGVLISSYLPCATWAKALIAFAACQMALPFTATTFAPLVSAMVLPVILGATSWIYPISSTVLTALIVGVRMALVHAGICVLVLLSLALFREPQKERQAAGPLTAH